MMPVPCGAGTQNHFARAPMAGHVVVQRAAFAQRNADQRFLRRFRRLADRLRHFARLAVTEADAALLIAHDDERGEAEALAALHNLCDAVDVDELVDQLARASSVAAAIAAADHASPPHRACGRCSSTLRRPSPNLRCVSNTGARFPGLKVQSALTGGIAEAL